MIRIPGGEREDGGGGVVVVGAVFVCIFVGTWMLSAALLGRGGRKETKKETIFAVD